MSERNIELILAAKTMFSRYGFQKTTMGDIAAEAGVARQTLYNAFPSKSEILRAVVRVWGDESYNTMKSAWAESDDLATNLQVFHDLGPLTWFEAINTTPDWADLMEGMHQAASEELDALEQKLRAALRDMMAPAHAAANPALSLDDLAEFFHASSINAKYGAENLDHLRTRLAAIKTATLAML